METESGLTISGIKKISSTRLARSMSLAVLDTDKLLESAKALLALKKSVGSSKRKFKPSLHCGQ